MGWDDDFDGDHDLDEGLDPEGPSAEDLDRFGDEMRVCPSCGSEIYDQAEICHVCGHAMERGLGRLPWWVVAVAALLIAVMLLFAL